MSSNSILFPYKTDPLGNRYPVIPISFIFPRKKRRWFALIDSGATISIFRPEVAESLGITINNGKEMYLGGVGGRIKGYVHELPIEVAGKRFRCPVVFSREYTVSFNLLGRKEFFRHFRITFEEQRNRVVLE